MQRLVGGLVVCVAVLILSGCADLDRGSPQLRFAQGSGICRPAGQAETAAVSARDGALWVSGQIATDTPAQHLVPVLITHGADLLLRITAVPKPGVSPLCLGMVGYEASITGLWDGTVQLRVEHANRRILDVTVTVGR